MTKHLQQGSKRAPGRASSLRDHDRADPLKAVRDGKLPVMHDAWAAVKAKE